MDHAVPARSYPHTFSWQCIAAKGRGISLFSGRRISGRGVHTVGGDGRFHSRQDGRSRARRVSARRFFSDACFGMPGRERIGPGAGACFTDGAAVDGGGRADSAFPETQTGGADFPGTGNRPGEIHGAAIGLPASPGRRETVRARWIRHEEGRHKIARRRRRCLRGLTEGTGFHWQKEMSENGTWTPWTGLLAVIESNATSEGNAAGAVWQRNK